jgi:P4 family phage/plasmid primase-like protien
VGSTGGDLFFDWAEARGLALAPLAPNGKTPIGNPWQDCSRDRAQWLTWLTAGNNFALPMGQNSLIAVDVDTKDNKPGVANWHAWQAQHGAFNPAWITPSGGAHVLFRAPQGDLRQPPLAAGIDVRAAHRSYVACPPSAIDGRRYFPFLNATIHDAPRVLVEHVQRAAKATVTPGSAGEMDIADVAALVKFLAERGEFESHDEWVKCGMALKIACGDDGIYAWRCAHDASVTAAVEAAKWNSFASAPTPGCVTIASLIKRGRELDWRGGVRKSAGAMFGDVIAARPVTVAPAPAPYPVPTHSLISGPPPTPRPPEYSEIEIAERFVDKHGRELRHVKLWGTWLHWTGKRWQRDNSDFVADLARRHCREESALCASAPGTNNARTLCSDRTVNAVLRLSRVDRRIAATPESWDQDHWLLGTPDGIIDLRTGEHRPALPEDHVTKSTAVTPGGECSRWLAFLQRVTGGDAELQSYLQRVAGYSLTGSTREHALFFAHGPGGSGKGTFMHALESVLAEYHTSTAIQTFTESKYDRHPAEIAAMHGSRLVTCSETEKGRHWAESRVKELTGGDTISARYMAQNFFNFVPTFKILISGNYRPRMRPDAAMRRRFQLIPFVVEIPKGEIDSDLGRKLHDELPGIFAWMVAGCVAWQREGLRPPPAVLSATEEYFTEEAEDVLTMWLHEACDMDATTESRHGDLYRSYKIYAEQAGERPVSSLQFGKDLKKLKFDSSRTNVAKIIIGLRLKSTMPLPTLPGMPPLPTRQ